MKNKILLRKEAGNVASFFGFEGEGVSEMRIDTEKKLVSFFYKDNFHYADMLVEDVWVEIYDSKTIVNFKKNGFIISIPLDRD